MNFTYNNWDRFCEAISAYNTILGKDIPLNSESSWLVIKHDVETNPKKALELARIESKYGLRCTYYVQGDLVERYAATLQTIAKLGHEVTYHYDVLDANSGNMQEALKEFNMYLNSFKRLGLQVKSICPHGNPMLNRSGWDSNRDFFMDEHIRALFPDIFDIVLDTPSSTVGGYTYVSDAGYGFKRIKNISTGKNQDVDESDVIVDFEGLKAVIDGNSKVIISTHPHRWFKSSTYFKFRLFVFFIIRKLVGYFSRFYIVKRLLSSLYKFARRF